MIHKIFYWNYSDIDIIAALGDSLTSATAANSANILEVLVENRGLSWCIGGQGKKLYYTINKNKKFIYNSTLRARS